VPRDLLAEVGGFHPALDRVGHNMLSSGDVHLQRQVLARGRRIRYEPAAAIGHLVPAGRLTQDWFRRRYYWQGISDAVMQLVEQEPTASQRARWLAARAGRLLASPRQLRRLVARTDDPHDFEQACWAWIAAGQVAGLAGAGGR
jgi:hypothetical protein